MWSGTHTGGPSVSGAVAAARHVAGSTWGQGLSYAGYFLGQLLNKLKSQ